MHTKSVKKIAAVSRRYPPMWTPALSGEMSTHRRIGFNSLLLEYNLLFLPK